MVTIARALLRHNTLTYDPLKCVGCGVCSQVCPHGVFETPKHRPAPLARPRRPARVAVARLVRPEDCMECGACQLNCPSGAISVDSGVGCAYALMIAALSGRKEATCDEECGCGG